jgi:UDP-2-acetamido-2-deoxy-ribo-hexuluronate aminotransferase
MSVQVQRRNRLENAAPKYWSWTGGAMTTRKSIDFNDLKFQQKLIYPSLVARIEGVLAHGQYIMGPEVAEVEAQLAAYVGVNHAVTCASGTDALLMVLMAKGVGPGDGVLTTPFTFIATAEVIQLAGATPVFVDIDPRTFNLDPEALEDTLSVWRKNPRTSALHPKGVIAVDLFGQPADYDRIQAIAERHGLFVSEDAAQSFGATYKGRRAGSLAETAATAFFPAKPLGCCGDGGAVFADDHGLAELLRSIRVHGQGAHRYEHVRLGINGRFDTIQAAALLSKLEIFNQEVAAREVVARRYSEALAEVVETPFLSPGCTSIWAQYSVLGDRRDELREKLQEAGIPTAIYYPQLLHLQPVFAALGCKPGDFPVSETAAGRIFSLPMHPYLTEADQDLIIDTLRS